MFFHIDTGIYNISRPFTIQNSRIFSFHLKQLDRTSRNVEGIVVTKNLTHDIKGLVTILDTMFFNFTVLNHAGKSTKASNRIYKIDIKVQRMFAKHIPQTKTTSGKKMKTPMGVYTINHTKNDKVRKVRNPIYQTIRNSQNIQNLTPRHNQRSLQRT